MMRRPGSAAGRRDSVPAPEIDPPSSTFLPVAVWYVAIIAVLLLIAAGIYIVFLHQQQLQWREAAEQMSIGQELLRADRDELLQKALEHEAELTALERQVSTRDQRLASLQQQRNELQAAVTGLEQDLTDARRRRRESQAANEASRVPPVPDAGRGDLDRTISERDAVIDEQASTIERLELSLVEVEELLAKSRSDAREKATLAVEASLEKVALEGEMVRARRALVEAKEGFRRGQVSRGHNASLGEVKPYLAEVGPEYWQVIEGWLEQKLQRNMTVPDLSTMGWSYEGARLLVAVDGPPMVMLLYADQKGDPISFTIAQDSSGEQSRTPAEQAGLNLLEWRDESHAFVLAGKADEVVLQVVASALQDQGDKVASDNPVPVGRFFRPEFRPESR